MLTAQSHASVCSFTRSRLGKSLLKILGLSLEMTMSFDAEATKYHRKNRKISDRSHQGRPDGKDSLARHALLWTIDDLARRRKTKLAGLQFDVWGRCPWVRELQMERAREQADC
jgi:hypothetical protein